MVGEEKRQVVGEEKRQVVFEEKRQRRQDRRGGVLPNKDSEE